MISIARHSLIYSGTLETFKGQFCCHHLHFTKWPRFADSVICSNGSGNLAADQAFYFWPAWFLVGSRQAAPQQSWAVYALGPGISGTGECQQQDIGSIFLFGCADSVPRIAPEIIRLGEQILSSGKLPSHVAWLDLCRLSPIPSLNCLYFPPWIFLFSSAFSYFFSFHPRGRGREVTWCRLTPNTQASDHGSVY